MDTSRPATHDIHAKWQWRPLPDGITTPPTTLEAAIGSSTGETTQTATDGDDVFHGRVGFALFQTQLVVPPKATTLHFNSVDDNATVYFDGKYVAHHEGWNDPFDVPLGKYQPGDTVPVEVIVENTAGIGGINDVWFSLGEITEMPKEAAFAFNDESWRTVHLPHDYVIEGTFNPADDPGHGALYRGQAWYRRTIDLPASARGKSVWIDFEGAYSDAHVWWNGHFLGKHRSGYTGFRFDLGPYANFGGRNELAVHLDANKTEGWWYEGGGIYRHVWLTIANPVHVAPLGGVYVTTTISQPARPRPWPWFTSPCSYLTIPGGTFR